MPVSVAVPMFVLVCVAMFMLVLGAVVVAMKAPHQFSFSTSREVTMNSSPLTNVIDPPPQ